MTELYTEEYARAQYSAYAKWRLISLLVPTAALIICVALCFFVNTRTSGALFAAVCALSITVGWAYLLFIRPNRRAKKAEYAHCKKILTSNEIEYHEGALSVMPYITQIPSSIRVKSVKLSGDDNPHIYHLNSSFSLPENGTYVKIRCVGNFVTAYEVIENAQIQ